MAEYNKYCAIMTKKAEEVLVESSANMSKQLDQYVHAFGTKFQEQLDACNAIICRLEAVASSCPPSEAGSTCGSVASSFSVDQVLL